MLRRSFLEHDDSAGGTRTFPRSADDRADRLRNPVESRRDALHGSGPLEQRTQRSTGVYAAVVGVMVATSVAVREPALHAGLFADDWDQYAMVQGIYPIKLQFWDLFNWVTADDSERAALLDAGRLPWWAARNVHLGVFRPLASVLTYLDYTTLDALHHPWRMHIHSLLWWLFLVGGVATLLGTLLPLPIAAISVGLYAFDDGHIVPFAWPANRSQLVALAFIIWALWLEVLAERRGSRTLRAIAAASVALGLAAGEHALAPLTYFAGFFLLGSGTWLERARKLLPSIALVAFYICLRASLGYGVAGSGFYVDPLSEPLRYAEACLTRVPLLLGELIFSASSEWWYWGYPWQRFEWFRELTPTAFWLQPGVRVGLVSLGIVAGVLTLAAIRQLGDSDGRLGERQLRWLLIGALVSLIPLSGTIALGRMTVAPAIAFNALIAYVAWRSVRILRQRVSVRSCVAAAAVLLVVFELAVIEPVLRSRDGAHYMHGITHLERGWVEKAEYGSDDLTHNHVFVLSSRDMASQFSITYILHAAGRAMPASATLLSPMGEKAQLLSRRSENVFDIEFSTLRTRVPPMNGSVYRSEGDPLTVGDVVSMRLFDVTIMDVENGQPNHLRFVFKSSVDDLSYVFLVATEEQLARIRMPAIGESVTIPAALGPL